MPEICTHIAAGSASLLALLLAYVNRVNPRAHLAHWSAAWAAFATGQAVAAAGVLSPAAASAVVSVTWVLFAAGVVAGAAAYRLRGGLPVTIARRGQLIVAGVALGAIAAATSGVATAAVGPTVSVVMAIVLGVALLSRRDRATVALFIGAAAVAGGDVLVALHRVDGMFVWLPYALLAAVTVGAAFEREREESFATIAQVERLALCDPLTGLPNRRLFADRAAVALAHARREGSCVAVVFLDLDRFKFVNDAMGHDVGDEVLKMFGKRLRDNLREGDTVARLGGDEFTLLLSGIRDAQDATVIAGKLLAKLRVPLQVGERSLAATASIGISVYPRDGSATDTLLRNADAAMYRAKQRGGDNVQLYVPGVDASTTEQAEIEARLRRAVAAEEFELYYQPRVHLETGRVVACEALIRWNEPGRGLVMPYDFLRAAEASGIIVPIGQWVLRTACAQAQQWHESGFPEVVVSINLSPRQFKQYDLPQTIADALQHTRLQARYLELEVDETGLMQDGEDSVRILKNLKAVGVRVLISGFGAGYSSLRYLRRFPIDGLKLDRSFLTGPQSVVDRTLATAALDMARALHLNVVGEGVETPEAAQFLREHSCCGMQGFLVSAALPAEQCTRFMQPAIAGFDHGAMLDLRRHGRAVTEH